MYTEVHFSDPYLAIAHKENINKFDLLLLAIDHDGFDYDLIEKEAKLIFGTGGRFIYKKSSENIINA